MTVRLRCFFAALLVLVTSLLALAAPESLAAPRARGRVFNVRDYGARGNGTIDDTRAIRAAIAAASGVRGTVLFPTGRYLYSDELLLNGVTLQGQSGAALLSDSANAYVKLIGAGGGVYDLNFELPFSIIGKLIPLNIIIVRANNCAVARNVFSFGFSPLVRHWCILVQSAASSAITNNTVRGPGGVYLQNAKNVTVSGNQISASTLATLPQDYSFIGVVSDRGNYNSIANNTISGAATNQLDGNSAGVILENQEANTSVTNNVINNFASAVVVKLSSNCRVERNQMNCSRSQFIPAAIDLSESANITVDANNISQASTDGIRAASMNAGLTISQNDIKNCGLDSELTNSSVIFVDSPDATIRIQNNKYSGTTEQLNYFIECKQPSPPAVVSGNTTTTMLPNRIGP